MLRHGSRICAALVGLVLPVALASPAAAVDRRPCVSKREFYAVPSFDPARSVIEARWEVTGRGVHMPQYDTRGRYVLAYKACGFDLTEVQVLVRYRLVDDEATAAQRYVRKPTATPNGHP